MSSFVHRTAGLCSQNEPTFRKTAGIRAGAKSQVEERSRRSLPAPPLIPLNPLFLTVVVAAEKKFWLRAIRGGSALINAEPPRPRIEALHIVDMSSSNSWAEFAAVFRSTRGTFLDHERAKSELRTLIPEDAEEAIGHGVRAKRSRSGTVSFDLLESEASRAAIQ
jgi:hypothetical protein